MSASAGSQQDKLSADRHGKDSRPVKKAGCRKVKSGSNQETWASAVSILDKVTVKGLEKKRIHIMELVDLGIGETL